MIEFKVKELKEITKTDETGNTETSYQYILEDVNDSETKMTIKTDETFDFLQPSSTIEIKALKTQTTVEAHTKEKKKE